MVTELINSEINISVADVALIETVFVLEKVKKISRVTINKAIMTIITRSNILCNRELFITILPVYIKHPKLSFVDCYLEVLAKKTMNTPLYTFDKKLANQLSGAQLLHNN